MTHFYLHPESDCIFHQKEPAYEGDAGLLVELSAREYGTLYMEKHGVLPEILITPYQHRWAEFCYENRYCAGWIEMGLGKTVATLMGVQQMIEDFEAAHVLVIGPKRVARKVWTDEIDKWEHLREFDVQKIIGTAAERERARSTRAEIHLINRENVTWLVDQYVQGKRMAKRWPWDTVIIDESTSFSYQSSQRWKSLRKVRKYMSRVIELTGTPDTRSLVGLWAQVYLLDFGDRLGASESKFHKKFFDMPNRMNPNPHPIPKHFARKQIQRRLKDIVMVLRTKDYLDVKDPWPVWHTVELTPSQRKTYDEMKKEFILEYAGEVITAVNGGVLANKLLQLSNGFIFDNDRNWHSFHDQKIDVLMEVIEGIQGPVMVAYNYVPDRIRIEQALTKAKINWRLLKTEKDERDWNTGKFDVLLFSPASAGEGTNLYENGCSDLVWFGLIWSLYQYQQTNARLTGGHRAVGKNIQLHHIITEGTYEGRVQQRLAENAQGQEEMLDGLREYVTMAA